MGPTSRVTGFSNTGQTAFGVKYIWSEIKLDKRKQRLAVKNNSGKTSTETIG